MSELMRIFELWYLQEQSSSPTGNWGIRPFDGEVA